MPDTDQLRRLSVKVAGLETRLNGLPDKVGELQVAVAIMQTKLKSMVFLACLAGTVIGSIVGGITVGVVVKMIGG